MVNDNKSLVNSFHTILKKEGYLVETATTGMQALDKAKKTEFHLAILNIELPDMTGDEVANKIKEQDDKTGIVLTTEYPTFEDCIDALDMGIEEIMVKPIGADELLRVTKEALYKRK